MKKIVIILLMSLVWVANASTAAAFLDNGISARTDAMGRAFTAVSDDLDAFYYNPAGFGLQKSARINSMFTKMNNINDVYYLGGGLSGLGGYNAFNFYTTGVNGIPETDYVNGQIVELGDDFNYSSQAFFWSYGRQANLDNLYWGISFKYIKETLYKNKAVGYGLDAGVLYRWSENLYLGASVLNLISPVMTWDTDSKARDMVERQQRFGVAYYWENFLFSADTTIRKYDLLASLGVEYRLVDNFALRGGLFPGSYSLGFGLDYLNFNFDYAYLLMTDTLRENTHKFSLGYVFDAKVRQVKDEKINTEVDEKLEIERLEQEQKVESLESIDMQNLKKTETLDNVIYGNDNNNNFTSVNIAEEKQSSPILVANLNRLSETLPDKVGKITVKRKSIVVGKDEIKCFYRVVSLGGKQTMDIRAMAVSAKGDLLGQDYLKGVEIKAQGEKLVSLLIKVKKTPGMKVKTFIKSGGQTLSYVDSVN